jgi:hypothetical protein
MEHDGSRCAAEVRQLVFELGDHFSGGRTGNVEARTQSLEADQETADGDAQDHQPRDDDRPGAAGGERAQSVQQLSHVSPSDSREARLAEEGASTSTAWLR